MTADAAPNAADMVRLSVSDNGPGMTSEVRDHCLEPFFTTKTRGISTGLGLAVVHGIIQNVHGALSIESAPGKGAVFTVTIPAAPAKSADSASPRKFARIDIQNARLRALVTFELSTLNVASGREASDLKTDPSLLIIDDGPARRDTAAEFLLRHPAGKVVVVGTEPQASSSDRVLEIGPIINRDVLRQALQVALT